jgi:hypothetical protein
MTDDSPPLAPDLPPDLPEFLEEVAMRKLAEITFRLVQAGPRQFEASAGIGDSSRVVAQAAKSCAALTDSGAPTSDDYGNGSRML